MRKDLDSGEEDCGTELVGLFSISTALNMLGTKQLTNQQITWALCSQNKYFFLCCKNQLPKGIIQVDIYRDGQIVCKTVWLKKKKSCLLVNMFHSLVSLLCNFFFSVLI